MNVFVPLDLRFLVEALLLQLLRVRLQPQLQLQRLVLTGMGMDKLLELHVKESGFVCSNLGRFVS